MNKSHGSPYDRGAADSYYRRSTNPHYWPEGTGRGRTIEEKHMTYAEVRAYFMGYDDNTADGNFKEYE